MAIDPQIFARLSPQLQAEVLAHQDYVAEASEQKAAANAMIEDTSRRGKELQEKIMAELKGQQSNPGVPAVTRQQRFTIPRVGLVTGIEPVLQYHRYMNAVRFGRLEPEFNRSVKTILRKFPHTRKMPEQVRLRVQLSMRQEFLHQIVVERPDDKYWNSVWLKSVQMLYLFDQRLGLDPVGQRQLEGIDKRAPVHDDLAAAMARAVTRGGSVSLVVDQGDGSQGDDGGDGDVRGRPIDVTPRRRALSDQRDREDEGQ